MPLARLTTGRVPGTEVSMSAGVQKPQEVKYYDLTIQQENIGFDDGWTFLVPIQAQFASIAGMRQGVGPSERIGRSIRIVGIVVRMEVTSRPEVALRDAYPYTVDLLWDLRPAPPPNISPGLIYDEAQFLDAPQTALPTVNNLSRFKFIKRVERAHSAPRQFNSTVDINIKCNKLVDFKDDTGAYQSVTVQPNLVICNGASLSCLGKIRYLYVDA